MIDGVIKLQTSGSSGIWGQQHMLPFFATLDTLSGFRYAWSIFWSSQWANVSCCLVGSDFFFSNACLGSSRPTAGPPAIDSYGMLKTHRYINLIILHHWPPKNIDIFMTPSVGQLVIFRNTWSIARRIGQVVEMMHCRTMTIRSSAQATERKELQNQFLCPPVS